MSVEIDITICFQDSDGEPVEGLRVDMKATYDSLSIGFFGEEVTDEDGCVTFSNMEGWKTYTLWVDHEEYEDIGVEGEDVNFDFTYDDPYKESHCDNDDEETEENKKDNED